MSNDVLQDLADQLTGKSEQAPQPIHRPVQRQPVQRRTNFGTFVKAAGPGGIIFDFSQAKGNPLAEHFSQLLNYHGDPQQARIARDQHNSYQKALGNFVEMGESQYNMSQGEHGFRGVHKDWDQQLYKSTDATIKKLYEEGNLVVDDSTSIEKAAGMKHFGDSKINLGNETIHATSETDQAIIDMMKAGMPADDEEE